MSLVRDQNGICYYCGGVMNAIGVCARPTLEHLIERRNGGGTNKRDCVAACFACNSNRPRFMNHVAYLEFRQSLLSVWPPCSKPTPEAKEVIRQHGIEKFNQPGLPILENPNRDAFFYRIQMTTCGEFKAIVCLVQNREKVFFWDSYHMHHSEAAEMLGIDPVRIISQGTIRDLGNATYEIDEADFLAKVPEFRFGQRDLTFVLSE
jgi:hypothetical protein